MFTFKNPDATKKWPNPKANPNFWANPNQKSWGYGLGFPAFAALTPYD